MVPNSIMAGATSRKSSSTPSRMIPPAMPKIPEMKEVTRMVAPTMARTAAAI
jgi:hypothetical protein